MLLARSWVVLDFLSIKRLSKFIFCSFLLVTKFEVQEAVIRRCFPKEIFLKISQNSQENTFAVVFFNNVTSLKACNFVKKRL